MTFTITAGILSMSFLGGLFIVFLGWSAIAARRLFILNRKKEALVIISRLKELLIFIWGQDIYLNKHPFWSVDKDVLYAGKNPVMKRNDTTIDKLVSDRKAIDIIDEYFGFTTGDLVFFKSEVDKKQVAGEINDLILKVGKKGIVGEGYLYINNDGVETFKIR